MRKEIHIGKKNYSDQDNGAFFYKCPECKESEIVEDFRFCPMCGVSLIWDSVLNYEEWESKDE